MKHTINKNKTCYEKNSPKLKHTPSPQKSQTFITIYVPDFTLSKPFE